MSANGLPGRRVEAYRAGMTTQKRRSPRAIGIARRDAQMHEACLSGRIHCADDRLVVRLGIGVDHEMFAHVSCNGFTKRAHQSRQFVIDEPPAVHCVLTIGADRDFDDIIIELLRVCLRFGQLYLQLALPDECRGDHEEQEEHEYDIDQRHQLDRYVIAGAFAESHWRDSSSRSPCMISRSLLASCSIVTIRSSIRRRKYR